MDICIISAIVLVAIVAVVVYMLSVNASLKDEIRMVENNMDNPHPRKSYILLIALLSIILLAGLFIAVRGYKADTDIPATTVETVSETEAVTTKPEENIHIEETEVPEMPSEAPSEPVTDETIVEVDPDELEMLACVIYQESGGNGSCDNCRRYVADVVLNRIEHPDFPDTMYEVLTQKDQYGRLHYTGIKWPERAKYDVEKEAVERAYKVAEEVLSGHHSELYGQGYIWQAGFIQGSDGFWCCDHFYGR